jgi:replicative DNA helicase
MSHESLPPPRPSERPGSQAAGPRRFAAASLIRAALDGHAAGDAIATGFPSLDALLGGGVRRGDLIVLTGDTGSGKSALALAMALHVCHSGRSAAFLSGEMTVSRLIERALAMQGGVRIDDLRRGDLDDETHAAVAAAALTLRESTPVFDDLGDAGLTGVSHLLAEHLGLDVCVVDPVESLAQGRLPVAEDVANAVRALKELAIRRTTAMLAISHLPQSLHGRATTRPGLQDLGGLGAVRQHADVVLGLYREEMYGPHPDVEGAAELHVLKNRNGPEGFVDLYFHREWLRFEEVV